MNNLFPAEKADIIAEMFSFTDEERDHFLNCADGILQSHSKEEPEK